MTNTKPQNVSVIIIDRAFLTVLDLHNSMANHTTYIVKSSTAKIAYIYSSKAIFAVLD